MKKKNSFSQRHPFIFGVGILIVAVVLVMGTTALLRKTLFDGGVVTGDKLGVVHVKGMILDARPITEWMRKLRENDEVLGVLIRIDSPGGGVAPSQEIYSGVKRLAGVKPVVASMASLGASGGYYVAASAHKIVANPATITGSIGVKMELSNVEDLMEKIGITRNSLVSGDYKDAGSPFKPMTPEEREYLKGVVMDLHRQFVTDVAEGRKMEREKVLELADGRIFTGREAHEKGLVDELGDLERSFELLKEMCKIKEQVPVIEGPEEEKSFLMELLGFESLKSEINSRGLKFVF
jgi:protease-4